VNRSDRFPQALLIVGFLTVIAGVPLVQTGIELRRGEPVRCTDLFRHSPTTDNLRRFEQSLEDTSWLNDAVRPPLQRALFATLRDAGNPVVTGREGWLFYRSGVEALFLADRPRPREAGSAWVDPEPGETSRESVVKAIVHFRDQLRQRGVQLLVVPVPDKASVYPDRLSLRAANRWHEFRSPTEGLLADLHSLNVETVDLFAAFRDAREKDAAVRLERPYYLAHDTHWTPAGARLAAETVAAKLRQLNWVPEVPYPYATKPFRVRRSGDIPQMMRMSGTASRLAATVVECDQVIDPFFSGPLVPDSTDPHGTYMHGHLVDTPMQASLLLLGDSFSRIYQIAEPASLGEVVDGWEPAGDGEHASGQSLRDAARSGRPNHADSNGHSTGRLLPGSAGFPSLLAFTLQAPVDYIISDGGAATEVRQRLNMNAEIFDGKKVVIWEFAERDIQLGRQGWQTVALPP